MIIKRLKLQNIRSYEEEEISFPQGALLLAGDIGSGKTSILLAIEYALFGLQPGQRGSALLRNGSDSGMVSLELEIDGKQVILERGLKRKNKTVNNDYSAYILDGEKTECSSTELKSKVIGLLSYPAEFIKKNNVLYRYTVYTPQEQMKAIILEEPEPRLNIIRHIFGVDKYKRIRENLLILIDYLKSESKILQGEIKTLGLDKERFAQRKEEYANLTKKISEQTLSLESAKKVRQVAEQNLKEIESKIREKTNFEHEVEKTLILISTKKERGGVILKEKQEIDKIIREMGEEFKEEKYASLIKELKDKKEMAERLRSKVSEIGGQLTYLERMRNENLIKRERIFKIDICPTCLQDVSETHKHNIMNESESEDVEIKKKINSFEEEHKKAIIELDKLNLSQNTLESDVRAMEVLRSRREYLLRSMSRLVELEKLEEVLKSDTDLLIQHLSSLKSEILKFSVFENSFKKKSEELKLAFQEEKYAEISLVEMVKELEITNKESAILEKIIAEKELSKKKMEHLSELVDWLSTQFTSLIEYTERNIMIKLRLEFSKVFDKWFHILVSQDSFEVHLDETFSPVISQSGVEMSYEFLSGGERTAVALAYRLALNQTINSVLSKIKTKNLVILDEPTEGFSETQLDKMGSVLEELNVSQLIIVSHEPQIENFVDFVIRLRKNADSSEIENNLEDLSVNEQDPQDPNHKT